MNKITVNLVSTPPVIGKPEMMSGIRTKEGAEKWAAKNGYTTVYWLKSRERVYADKANRVDIAARALEAKSAHLLQMSESAQGLVEYALILALVAGIIFIVCNTWPW